jgi:tetratricopeptide (TPR) repeat protein/predicted Ser/Thr protein kinase
VQTIGKYQVEKVLGRGGMGTVYLAHDPVIDRKVALKTMAPGVAETPELKARFLREAEAAGGLRHRNIVAVYDLGEERGQPYIAMEYIEGTDLEKIIQRHEPLSVEWKLDVLRQVCEGLAHAHRNGIVHRDVKPANIRVTPEGEVKIMDFGIAHLQSSTLTKSGLVLGTIHYMAPEQVEGGKADQRSDVFSVGAVAYELFAYRKPFDGESATSVMFQIVRQPPDMSALPPTAYSPGLERVVERALAKRQSERYQSLEEMRDDLERLVRDTAARILSARGEEGPGPDVAFLKAALEPARAAGHLQKALTLCRRVLERDPGDAGVRRLEAEVEAAIREKEIEQLSGMALGYAAEGDVDFAMRIAGKVARLAPASPKYQELMAYLDEENARRTAGVLLATAQEHIVLGNLEEARAAAEEVLAAQPGHGLAREIRDRAARIIETRSRSAEASAAAPRVEDPQGTRLRDGARRKAEAAALATAALNRFLQNDHGGARALVEKALALEPGNRKAQELLKILGSLG